MNKINLWIKQGVKKGDTITMGGNKLYFYNNHWRWKTRKIIMEWVQSVRGYKITQFKKGIAVISNNYTDKITEYMTAPLNVIK